MNNFLVALRGNLIFILGLGVLAVFSIFSISSTTFLLFGIAFITTLFKLIKLIFSEKEWRGKERRVTSFGGFLVIFLGFIVFSNIYTYKQRIAREEGDYIVEQVYQYYKAYGKYPDEVNDLDLMRKADFYVWYYKDQHRVSVGYKDPVMVLDSWMYDFQKET